MATIKVDSTAMREKSDSFNTIANNIGSYTEQLEREINGMRSVWEGGAAESTIAKFSKFKEGFEEKKHTIQNYSKFLSQAADAYDNSENSMINGSNS